MPSSCSMFMASSSSSSAEIIASSSSSSLSALSYSSSWSSSEKAALFDDAASPPRGIERKKAGDEPNLLSLARWISTDVRLSDRVSCTPLEVQANKTRTHAGRCNPDFFMIGGVMISMKG